MLIILLLTEMEAESENPIPPTPPREVTPEPEIKEASPEVEEIEDPVPSKSDDKSKGDNSGGKRRVRRRKQVKKTTMGDDGFMGKEIFTSFVQLL